SAVPTVAAYAQSARARVCVLHVQRDGAGRPAAASRRLVTAVVEQLWGAGVDACGEVRVVRRGDDAADVVTRAASAAEADLVAITVHGSSGLGAAVLGGVSHRVAAGLEVPVLVLRASANRPGRPAVVLVAVDGSPASRLVVAEAADLARAFTSRVHVVHVEQVSGEDGESGRSVRAVVEVVVAGLRAGGVEATGECIRHSAVAVGIAGAAARLGADLVVMGCRRPTELGGLLLGSVAHRAVHILRSPVLLVPTSRAAAPARARRGGQVHADRMDRAVVLLRRA
ncbi:MAG TPA: universal stress protein, partial [Candidatus Eisenbacteria bacterium]|nr:universal stress protein [Candidatus Eisenbacteria bacterium]